MKQRLRRAYIRGIIDVSVWLLTMGFYIGIGVNVVEKYFL